MIVLRKVVTICLGSILHCCLAAALSVAAGIVINSSAMADDVPFYERDYQAAKEAKAKKRYAYKKSYKSKYYSAKSGSKKLGGYAEATEPKKRKKGWKVAALDGGSYGSEPKKSLSGGSVRWAASSACLDGALKAVIYAVAANYGPVTVNSTCRSRGHNARVGGAKRSKHLTGDAVDFRVHGNTSGLYAFLRSQGVGGLKHYSAGHWHIDNGDRRTW